MEKEWLEHLAPYQNHTFVLGCSGGLDSMVMLHFLVHQQFMVHVVHVNYHQRGEASELDQQLVEKSAKELLMPCAVFHYANEHTLSSNFQESARIFRYGCFEEISKNYEQAKIILAHHADDQVETFFMNLSRKSGLMGLAGMPLERGNILRPFLWTAKNDLLNYAKKHKIAWREDASNASNKYYRNRWRNEFIPLMESEVPALTDAVIQLMKCMQEEQLRTETSIQPIYDKILISNSLELVVFESLTHEERFELWRKLGQPAGTFSSFEQLAALDKGKKVNMVGDFAFVLKEDNTLHFEHVEKKATSLPSLMIEESKVLPPEFSKLSLYLDKSLIEGELKIRRWKIGDRIASVGIAGTQLVSDIIKDAKVPNHQKNNVFVVEDSTSIHWVVGLKIGRKALAQASSRSILKVGIRTFEK